MGPDVFSESVNEVQRERYRRPAILRISFGGSIAVLIFFFLLVFIGPLISSSTSLFAGLVIGLVLVILLIYLADAGRIKVEYVAFLAALAVLSASIASATPWLPPERVIMGGEPRTLYILRESDDGYVVFDPNAHAVQRVAKGQLTARQYCSLESTEGTLITLMFGKPDLPECP
jgi:hypothetical protein